MNLRMIYLCCGGNSVQYTNVSEKNSSVPIDGAEELFERIGKSR